jgi:flagellar hook-basal body complex protein FliE
MDISKVESLLAEMRSAVAIAQNRASQGTVVEQSSASADFASVLKSSLDTVAQMQNQAESMQKSFLLGDDKVNLSDTMISMQKANIAFQTTVQVRNRIIAAYNDIMNMQV